jgi:hypothetical protein
VHLFTYCVSTRVPADYRAAALRDRYVALGVTFDGPDVKDGGAILDECSSYNVSGHSSPNFLAFDTDYGFSSNWGRAALCILNQRKIIKIQVHFKPYIAFFGPKNNVIE